MRTGVRLIFIGLLFLVCTCVTDDGDFYKKYFIKYYGMDGDHEAADMIVNADGTVVLLGTTEFPANSGNTKIYVTKISPAGEVLWENTFGSGTDFAQDIEPISNGYVILSNITIGVEEHQFKLIRIDDNGSKLTSDSIVYNLLEDQFGQSVTPLSDGGFYVVGSTFDFDETNADSLNFPPGEIKDMLYIRIANTFSLPPLREDRPGGSSLGSAIKVFETSPGAFTSSEYTNQTNNSITDPDYEYNFVFRNFTSDPKSVAPLWIGDVGIEESLNQTVSSSDGNFYSIGTSNIINGPSNSSTIFIAKTSGVGAIPAKLFDNSFGSGMEGVSIFPSAAYCYVVGNVISESDGTRDIWLTKVNSFTGDQDPAWIKGVTFGTATNDDTGKVVAEAPNGDIIILGTMNLTNQKKIALIKLSHDGKFTP